LLNNTFSLHDALPISMLLFLLYFCNQGKAKRAILFALLFYKRTNNYLDNYKNQPHNCSSFYVGGIPKWLTGADCKSAGLGLRRFESYSPHHFFGCGDYLRAQRHGRADAHRPEAEVWSASSRST